MSTTALQPTNHDQEKEVSYIPFGGGIEEKIRLTTRIIQTMIAVPTKTGKLPTAEECWKFMMLCRARHLNPFEGDVYLLGYDMQGGEANFSIITAHQVFLKRAEGNPQFDGMDSGVIIQGDESVLIERDGDLLLRGEKLVGGWAKVYRKDRSRPFYRRLTLDVFSTGKSRWSKDPAGMIVKCAEADGLRSAFPTHLGDLYTADELPTPSPELLAASPTLDTLTVPSVDVAVLAGQCYGAIGTKGGRARKQVDEDVVKMIRIGESHENILRHFCTKAGVEWPNQKQKPPEVIMPKSSAQGTTVEAEQEKAALKPGVKPLYEYFDSTLADQVYAADNAKFGRTPPQTDQEFHDFLRTEVSLGNAKLAFMRHLEMIGTGATVEEPTPKQQPAGAPPKGDEYERI
jgi:phage recombination protein Bet